MANTRAQCLPLFIDPSARQLATNILKVTSKYLIKNKILLVVSRVLVQMYPILTESSVRGGIKFFVRFLFFLSFFFNYKLYLRTLAQWMRSSVPSEDLGSEYSVGCHVRI